MNFYEDLHRDDERLPSDRSFGLVMAAFFTAVSLWPLVHERPLRPWALAFGILLLLAAAAWPSSLHALNRAWMRLGRFIGLIVNPVLMALLFFAVLTPLAILLRLFGKDPLRLRSQCGATTYWIPREPPGPEPATMVDQF